MVYHVYQALLSEMVAMRVNFQRSTLAELHHHALYWSTPESIAWIQHVVNYGAVQLVEMIALEFDVEVYYAYGLYPELVADSYYLLAAVVAVDYGIAQVAATKHVAVDLYESDHQLVSAAAAAFVVVVA